MARLETKLDDVSPGLAFEKLQGLLEWKQLRDVIQEELRTKVRRVLSHHTTKWCQPRHEGGLVSSLKDKGLDYAISDAQGLWHLSLTLDAAFEPDDGFTISYTGVGPTEKKAKETACYDVLMILLAHAPGRVKLAPGALKWGPDSVKRIRHAAVVLRGAAGEDAVLVGEPRDSPGTPRARPQYEPPADEAAREQEILELLRDAWPADLPIKPWNFKGGRETGPTLGRLLPEGGLLDFLSRHPDEFACAGSGKELRVTRFESTQPATEGPQQREPAVVFDAASGSAQPAAEQPTAEQAQQKEATGVVDAAADDTAGDAAGDATRDVWGEGWWDEPGFWQ